MVVMDEVAAVVLLEQIKLDVSVELMMSDVMVAVAVGMPQMLVKVDDVIKMLVTVTR